jgi:hypothetical protein
VGQRAADFSISIVSLGKLVQYGTVLAKRTAKASANLHYLKGEFTGQFRARRRGTGPPRFFSPELRRPMTFQGGIDVSWPRVSVVIPALNEAGNLPHVFIRMPPNIHEVILVDGHSVDGTVTVARQLRPDVRVVTQTRKGKGNALACGFSAATGDIVAMIDADGSTDPAEIPCFVQALLDGADFAKGTRFAKGGGSADITRLRGLGNRALSMLVNLFYRTRYSDLCYGFNAFWRRHVPVFGLDAASPAPPDGDGRLWGDGFEVETLINIRVAKAGLVVSEVPSFERPRIHGASNLSAVSDGLRVLRTILVERFRSRRRTAGPIGRAAPPAPVGTLPGETERTRAPVDDAPQSAVARR